MTLSSLHSLFAFPLASLETQCPKKQPLCTCTWPEKVDCDLLIQNPR